VASGCCAFGRFDTPRNPAVPAKPSRPPGLVGSRLGGRRFFFQSERRSLYDAHWPGCAPRASSIPLHCSRRMLRRSFKPPTAVGRLSSLCRRRFLPIGVPRRPASPAGRLRRAPGRLAIGLNWWSELGWMVLRLSVTCAAQGPMALLAYHLARQVDELTWHQHGAAWSRPLALHRPRRLRDGLPGGPSSRLLACAALVRPGGEAAGQAIAAEGLLGCALRDWDGPAVNRSVGGGLQLGASRQFASVPWSSASNSALPPVAERPRQPL